MALLLLLFSDLVWSHDLFSHEFTLVVLLEKKSELSAQSTCLLNCRFTVICLQRVSKIGRKVRKLDQWRDFLCQSFLTWLALSVPRITMPDSSLANTLQRNVKAAICYICFEFTNGRRPYIDHLFFLCALRHWTVYSPCSDIQRYCDNP